MKEGNIAGCEIHLNTTSEITAASFQCIDKEPLIICALYRPPSSDQAYMEEVCSQIRGLHSQFQRSAIWIGGDANLPDIEWDRNAVNSNSNKHVINQLSRH